MVKYFQVLTLVLAHQAFANKALDLLDQEEVKPGAIYAPIGVVDRAKVQAEAEKAAQPKPMADPAVRWPTSLQPIFRKELETTSPYLQEIALTGNIEYQLQSGSQAQSSHLRRAHVGAALRAFYDLEIDAEIAFDGSGDYLGFDTLRARYSFGNDVSFSAGKFRPSFSAEYSRDPALRLFPDLSPLVSQIAPGNTLGALIETRNWKLGYFNGDTDAGIPDLSGRGFLLAGVRHGGWYADYVYNFERGGGDAIPLSYRHLFATGVKAGQGKYDFASEFLLAEGDENTSWGVTLRGGYWLAQDALRLVGRYHYAASSEAGGILSGWGVARAESDLVQPFRYNSSTAADSLHSFYLGMNLHLYEDNLILGAGLEYRTLIDVVGGGDLDSWNWNTTARMAF